MSENNSISNNVPEIVFQVSERNDYPLASCRTIAENNYCTIFLGSSRREQLIIKHYKTVDSKLAELELNGIRTYHEIAGNDREFLDCRPLFIDREEKINAFSFVPGISMADFIYDNFKNGQKTEEIGALMNNLGQLLSRMRKSTGKANLPPVKFHLEYFQYCSENLNRIPILGKALFRDFSTSTSRIASTFEQNCSESSFAHGDLVFRNIHVHENRIGLIDFANCLVQSHILNDCMNLWFALKNMLISDPMRKTLWDFFLHGLGSESFPEYIVEFFYEYHRRRWLMLNLKTRNPIRWLRAFKGLKTFAGGFSINRNGIGL